MANINTKYNIGERVFITEFDPEAQIYETSVVSIRIEATGISYLTSTFGWFVETELSQNIAQARKKLRDLWAERAAVIDNMPAKSKRDK